MWETLANDPWPVFGGLFAVACLAAWWSRRTGSKPAFFVALLLFALSLLPLVAGLFVDTPYKQVDKLVHELVASGEAGDHKKISDALDPNYNYDNRTKTTLAKLIETELTSFRPDYVSLHDLVIEAKPDAATASFRATTGGRYQAQGMAVQVPRYLVRLRLHFAKREGRWVVTEIHRFDPQSGQEIALDSK